jgi:hypothetical protein
LVASQVASLAADVPVPQTQPHMGTVLPSGRVVVCLVAVRFTVDCANDAVAAKSRTAKATPVLVKAGMNLLRSIASLLIKIVTVVTAFRR